ncbi:hypothetical protein TMatcc_005633 [Talaromyces marneffei ATCC 18224]|uniref:Allantoin permease, putative n=1 Tax=Talaromyces marneffei (strain ATCC 18224 / CBS 334.59 / QM 7333) TaxID=441960 RepID=B6Q9N1_TALMQ|nr:uncharacterized protein EYB26_005845 [Talaromyces marneffei]EEA26115.1 allantoin permease, putative [Talaromyces marneffei ATCC 18224]KAE8554823.1 hypothetical protein EYB25_003367 [Talaromyces marneffei]QGA18164.1 hypothetical protein EYB26_005845 [Talaromyces marneffei]
MSDTVRRQIGHLKSKTQGKSKLSGWVLPRETTSFADEGTWTNIDADVTPLERRTWSTFTVLGFWFSDALNAQGWEGPSSIIQLGLTWREAFYLPVLGGIVDTIPLILNGAIGAHYHIPFPVVTRSSFGYYFSRFAVIVRLITAIFWNAIQTWTGSQAMYQVIRAIWPSFLNIPNHLPEKAGITTSEMIAHLVFWCVQTPIMLTPPHKLKWFFVVKVFVVLIASTGTVIAMTYKAHGVGDIWNQEYSVSGSARSWLIMSQFSAQCGGWATMATNIPDFTRYMRNGRGVYWQALMLPSINLLMSVFGTISTSCAKVVYGTYIWSPLELASHWDGPSGRCGAFFVGLCWVIAQIGTNMSASVISAANDLTNLFPKYINIRRGVILVSLISGWIMVPWKIVYSASSLITFIAALAVFLAPIASILASDYWIVKNRNFDVPGLYRRHGRYRYQFGVNWRSVLAFLVAVTPALPGLANSVSSSVKISTGLARFYDCNYLYSFLSGAVVYVVLSKAFPATETLLDAPIYDDDPAISDAVEHMRGDNVDSLWDKEAAMLESKEGGIDSQGRYTQ